MNISIHRLIRTRRAYRQCARYFICYLNAIFGHYTLNRTLRDNRISNMKKNYELYFLIFQHRPILSISWNVLIRLRNPINTVGMPKTRNKIRFSDIGGFCNDWQAEYEEMHYPPPRFYLTFRWSRSLENYCAKRTIGFECKTNSIGHICRWHGYIGRRGRG